MIANSDTGVVEHVERQSDDGLEPIIFNDPAADVAFTLASIASEQRAAVVQEKLAELILGKIAFSGICPVDAENFV